ncbi:MAG: HAD family phosphatase [Chloroflexota bacterium]|nr:HAD family phosphatase [Chloroflexota bacterium]
MDRAVVFDLGGVLIDWNPRHLYRKLIADGEQMEWFLANVTTPEWNLLQDRGRTLAEATDELVARHPEHEQLIRAYYERWPEMLAGPIDENVVTLAELRAAGVPLYALTNWSAETFRIGRRSFDFLDWFSGIVISGEERLAKPDEAIFRILLDRFQLRSAATTFIDDSLPNVEQARRLGIDGVHYTSPPQLRADLAARGLPIRA